MRGKGDDYLNLYERTMNEISYLKDVREMFVRNKSEYIKEVDQRIEKLEQVINRIKSWQTKEVDR